MITELAYWLDAGIHWFTRWWPQDTMLRQDFNVRAMLAVLTVALLCGAMGSMVVSCRMAFFSDALAHCAFAGVALGLLIGLVLGAQDAEFRRWITTIMVVFGLIFGLLIGYVRERTGLSSDTVIGVFFAVAVGLGGMFQRAASGKRYFNLEHFLFGDPVFVKSEEIIWLILLIPVTAAYLWRLYNPMVFGNFNPSLARSRQLPTRVASYLFIALLALIINLCVQIVGVLLITGMLIVPAATAMLISRNMRQFFWYSIGLSLLAGAVGTVLAFEVRLPDPASHNPISFGVSGTIIVCSGLLFVTLMLLRPGARQKG